MAFDSSSLWARAPKTFTPAVRAPAVMRVAWVVTLVASLVSLCAALYGPSLLLAHIFGLGILAALGFYLAPTLVFRPLEVCRPMTLFSIGCIYFLVLDAALVAHRTSTFSPRALIASDTLVSIFLIAATVTHRLIRFRRNFVGALFKHAPAAFSGDTYFLIAAAAVVCEYLWRLYCVDFDPSRLIHDLTLGRGGGAFRIGVADDWRVLMAPIQMLFLFTTVFADLAWRRGVSPAKRILLIIIVAVQLTTLVLDTVRGDLLLAILTPVFVRTAQFEKSAKPALVTLLVTMPLLVPLANVMNYARNGWRDVQIAGHALQAPTEDDFFWLTNLVASRDHTPGLLAYKGPFGFASGLGEIGSEWAIIAVPRALWPGKPKYWEQHDDTRGWYAADSVVGDLFRAGGISCLIAGAVVFGLWLSLLDTAYQKPKSDGEAIAYALLAVTVVSMTRDALPFNNVSLLLSAMLFIIVWNLTRVLVARRACSSSFAIRRSGVINQMAPPYPARAVMTGGEL